VTSRGNLRNPWDEISDRTRFYPLRPKGTETPFVEGLTGYVRRLATAHGVTVADLICDSHFDNLFPDPIDHRTRRRLFLASGYLLDGAGHDAQKWIAALEAATGQLGLGSLTLGPFAGIDSFSWLRRRRAWCSYCLSLQAQNDPDELYEPLLWSIRLVSVCPVDLTPLAQRCPNCNASLTPFAGIAAPGYCGRCGGPLWENASTEMAPVVLNSTEIYHIWCSVQFSSLLGASNDFDTPLQPPSIARVLAARFQSLLEQSRKASALAVGCSKRSSYLWARGAALPRIDTLFRLSFNLGISPLDLFRQVLLDSYNHCEPSSSTPAGESITGGDGAPHQLAFNFPIRKPNGRIQYDPATRAHQIKDALEKALGQMPPPTLHATATLLKMSSSTELRKLEPDLCKQIHERHQQWEKDERSRMEAAFREVLSQPRPLSSFERFCSESGFPMSLITRQLPELKAAYIAKYRAVRLALRRTRTDENRSEVERVVKMICDRGEYPSVGRVKAESQKLHSLGWDEIQVYIRDYFAPESS
jgi:hypothetical protein